MNCKLVTVREDGDWNVHRCENCGREIKSHSLASKTHRICRVNGLGDYVAAGLTYIGVTKEKVAAVVGSPCDCEQRQEALNDLGKKIGL